MGGREEMDGRREGVVRPGGGIEGERKKKGDNCKRNDESQ